MDGLLRVRVPPRLAPVSCTSRLVQSFARIGAQAVAWSRILASTRRMTTLHAHGRRSSLLPFVTLYNRVADARPIDLDACISAALVGNDTIRAVAAHGYGNIDVSWRIVDEKWVTLELSRLGDWHADPYERHVQLASLGEGLLDVASAPYTAGMFQGQRGIEGKEAWSAGFFTLSSTWQQDSTFVYVEKGQRVAFTCVQTAALPKTWDALRAAEGLRAYNPNRALTWYWTNPSYTSEATIDTVIARAKALGARLIFFLQATSNLGDYLPDPKRFPSGLKYTADKVRAAGLKVGLHIVSSGADAGAPGMKCGPTASRKCVPAAKVARERIELFVPQGLTTRDYYVGTDAGTWWGHEGSGSEIRDHTRHVDSILPPSQQPPPPNPIRLHHSTWSPLGRFRNGSAPFFDGATSYGELAHAAEYEFSTTFSLQMVVHVARKAATTGATAAEADGSAVADGRTASPWQMLAFKHNAWQLLIGPSGKLEWHVKWVGGEWSVAKGQTVLTPDGDGAAEGPWVVKATVNSSMVAVHVCALVDEPVRDAHGRVTILQNRCKMRLEGSAPAATGGATGDAQLARSTANISFGAELPAGGGTPHEGFFSGALEEIMLSKVDTSSWRAFNWNCPATGVENFYIFDYVHPAARAYWANATASLFNLAQSSASQWDGAEFQPSIAGWGLRHSAKTFHSSLYDLGPVAGGRKPLWLGGALTAFEESRQLWQQPMAVEMSFTPPGLYAHADMAPFSDEQRLAPSHGGKGMCVGGQEWVGQMLKRTHVQGTVYNGYNTPVNTLPNVTWVDCFIGALVAAGVPPQPCDRLVYPPDTTPSARVRDARIGWWNERAAYFGHTTESSTRWLHIGAAGDGTDAIFSTALVNGEATGGRHYGLFAASGARVVLPSDSWEDNSTLVAFATTRVVDRTLRLSFGNASDSTARFFAASDVILAMDAGWWTLAAQDVVQTLVLPNGTEIKSKVFGGKPVSGAQNVTSPALTIGSVLVYQKVPA